ncbi:2-dehydro-3-deoxyphosphogluconate aldolase/(4S)-4-hydroxy-2-oxoglutarate aldolase [Kroppenstedtia sanguinis]|uniref:Bifunctional 2-keto-4-hydroxyglutarate aldolase/2-keto-3-deoxy-6-phosphogluconate aldolase n=1 Tax=Kroppenstedtia sanguinis TaxID=1380684 RepID=A0ABW4C5H5_9BACL
MMRKQEILTQVEDSGLVAVVRADHAEQAKRITEAAMNGGVVSIEITYTVAGATDVIKELNAEFGEDLIVGAGTVLDAETARIAILAGAKYVVSPYLDEKTARMCNRYQIPYLPGVMTIQDVVHGLECGAEVLKVFPGDLMGPQMIRVIKGPIPQANLMPTGGVSVDNVANWIRAGAVAVGAGGSLIGKPDVDGYEKITETAKRFLEQIEIARNE